MKRFFYILCILPLLSWSQSDCHHRSVAISQVDSSLPRGLISDLTAVQDRVVVSTAGKLNQALVCEWVRNSGRSSSITPMDELPEWDATVERTFTRTSTLGRAFNALGSGLIRAKDMAFGFTPRRMEEILNEVPERMKEFEKTPGFQACAPFFQNVADKCMNGNTDMSALYSTLRCQRMDSKTCIESKCGMQVAQGQLESCSHFVPLSIQHWNANKNRFKYSSFMTGLYLIKNETAERNIDRVPRESSQQRLVRRTINHVMGFITPENDIPDRVDTPMGALERGETNCLGYSLSISSALRYSAAGTGVRSEIVTHVTPAHAWNRIELTEPQMTFDVDGSQYGTGYKPGSRPTYEFLPLPPRSYAGRSECPANEANLPFCTANVSDSELMGERERGRSGEAARNASSSRQ